MKTADRLTRLEDAVLEITRILIELNHGESWGDMWRGLERIEREIISERNAVEEPR